jgi:hypothetical protein
LILTPVAEIPWHPRTFKGSGLQELLEQTRRTTRRPGIAGTPAGGRAEGWSEIFREKVSGARPDRRELLKLLKALTPGDVVTVTRIDRLARSIFDLFAIVKQIVDAGGNSARWRSHGADTATSTGRLMIAVLGGPVRRSPRLGGPVMTAPAFHRDQRQALRQAAVEPEQPALFELRDDCPRWGAIVTFSSLPQLAVRC